MKAKSSKTRQQPKPKPPMKATSKQSSPRIENKRASPPLPRVPHQLQQLSRAPEEPKMETPDTASPLPSSSQPFGSLGERLLSSLSAAGPLSDSEVKALLGPDGAARVLDLLVKLRRIHYVIDGSGSHRWHLGK